jgi:hypothetical protein
MNTRNPKLWALIGFGVGAVIASAGAVVHPLDSLIGGLIQAALWFGVSSFVLRKKNSSDISSEKSALNTSREKRSNNLDSTSLKTCDKCGKELEPVWGHCPACLGTSFTHKQRELNPFAERSEEAMLNAFPAPVTSPDANVPEFKVCPMCAEQIKYAAKKCRYCQHLMGE